MATLTVNGQAITVDNSFLQLSPAQQEATVNEIASSLKAPGQNPANATGQIDTGNPMAQAPDAQFGAPAPDLRTFGQQAQDVGNQLSAGFTAGVNALPIAGPAALSGLEGLKGMVQGRPQADVAATDQAQVQANPTAAAIGGVAGTVLPFALGGAIPGVSRLLGMSGGLASRAIFGGLSSGVIGAADTAFRGGSLNDVARNALIDTGIGAVAAPLFGVGGTAIRRMSGAAETPTAIQNVAKALTADQIPVGEINSRLAQVGQDGMLMDLGPNLQRQAGAVASVPGQGQTVVRNAVVSRAAGASNRVASDVASTIGSGPDAQTLIDQIASAQKQAADPLYQQVRDVVVKPTGNLTFVMQTPAGKKAFAQALKMAQNDGYGYQSNTVGLMDYMKQALDDQARTAARLGNNNAARGPANLARLLRTEVDKQVPGYATARDTFAGYAAVKDAVTNGLDAFGKDVSPAQLQSQLSGMTASERDAYSQGARSSVEAMMGNAVNDSLALRNLFKKGWNEQKLTILLGKPTADELLTRLDREAGFGQSANVVTGNSETASRQAFQAQVAPNLKPITPPPQTGMGAVLAAFNKARMMVQNVRQPAINKAMADILTKTRSLPPEDLAQLQAAMKARQSHWLAPAVPGLMVPKGNIDLSPMFQLPSGANTQDTIGLPYSPANM